MKPDSIFVPKWLGGVIARLEKTENGCRVVVWENGEERWSPVPNGSSVDAAAVLEASAASPERLSALSVPDPISPRFKII